MKMKICSVLFPRPGIYILGCGHSSAWVGFISESDRVRERVVTSVTPLKAKKKKEMLRKQDRSRQTTSNLFFLIAPLDFSIVFLLWLSIDFFPPTTQAAAFCTIKFSERISRFVFHVGWWLFFFFFGHPSRSSQHSATGTDWRDFLKTPFGVNNVQIRSWLHSFVSQIGFGLFFQSASLESALGWGI